jgi:hypothetical protein
MSLTNVTQVKSIESELDTGLAIEALRRFNDAVAALPADTWRARLRPVFNELAHDLETFNPAFTAVLFKVCIVHIIYLYMSVLPLVMMRTLRKKKALKKHARPSLLSYPSSTPSHILLMYTSLHCHEHTFSPIIRSK